MHADHFRRKKINRLPEHSRFCFDSADAPTDHAESIDHGRVRVRSDECVGKINAVAFEHAFREIFEIHLVHDADAGRHELESFKRLLSPF